MCTVSFVGDSARDKWLPYTQPYVPIKDQPPQIVLAPAVSQSEFDRLRQEVAEIRELLIAAREIDERLGLADCEMEEKVEFLRAFAKLLDVDLDDVL